MPRYKKKQKRPDTRGIGECGDPLCSDPKAPERNFCSAHSKNLDRIRKEFEEDPLLLYNQRSDSGNRVIDAKKTKRPRTPTCCMPGCYELRVAPAVYCFAHEGEERGE